VVLFSLVLSIELEELEEERLPESVLIELGRHQHSHNPLNHPLIVKYRLPALLAICIFLTLVVTS
jgi:hypothetical protein